MFAVEHKQKAVQVLKQQVDAAEADLDTTQRYIHQLKHEKEISEKRLINADKLTNLLADEGKRWEKSIEEMQAQSIFVNGDVFLASSEISYLGPFSQSYRDKLTKIWRGFCD